MVEPDELAAYQNVWSEALFVVLPQSGGGAGFVRNRIQLMLTKSFLTATDNAKELVWRLPYAWLIDDNISAFYKLTEDGSVAPQRAGSTALKRPWAAPRKKREVCTFEDAFVAVQTNQFLPSAGISGFLRDDGTAACKRDSWRTDVPSIYKAVLVNVVELQRLGIAYEPDLRMYEDLNLTLQLLGHRGRTLKCRLGNLTVNFVGTSPHLAPSRRVGAY